MKRVFSLSAVALLALGAQAQNSNKPYRMDKDNSQVKAAEVFKPFSVSLGNMAKTTATPFWTENFSSGTNTTLPTGWSAAGGNGVTQTWKWTNVASNGSFNLGALNSPTASNGWMIYDSDKIGDANPTVTPLVGTLTSPVIDCSGKPTVAISFYQFFRRFQDTCFLEVSNNGGTSYTTFPVLPNNSYAVNTSLPTNPTLTTINVTSVAANQANVRIRFRYVNVLLGGAFNWMIDDVTAAELDPIDLEVSDASMVMTTRNTTENAYTAFGTLPRQFADTVFPVARVTNRGSTAPANVTVNANIRTGGTSVYNKNVLLSSVPTNAFDSLVDFRLQTGFTPTALGTYTAAFGLALTGDPTPNNNVDTATLTVSDSVMSRNDGFITGGFIVHAAPAGTNPERSNFIGTIFDIPAGKKDTVTGASVIFASSTTAGTNATVQIYKFENEQWNFVTLSSQVTLNASNISTTGAGGSKFAYFPMEISAGSVANYILDGGATGATYAAVVQGNQNPTTSTVTVSASGSIAESVVGISGVAYTSTNDGGTDFGLANLPGGLAGSTPWVRLHFSNYKSLGLKTIEGLVGSVVAYPNPSNNQLFVPVTLSKAAELSVTLSTQMGQVVARQDFGKTAAGQEVKAAFNTAGLANGVYFYTVEVAGERITNRVVVSH